MFPLELRLALQRIPLLLVAACGSAGSAEPTAPCPEEPAADAEEATQLYLDAWNDPDPFERRCAVDASVSGTVTWMDGQHTSQGPRSVIGRLDAAAMELAREGLTRELRGAVTFRHQEALATWALVDSSGAILEEGQDWLELSADGRIERIHTFAGRGEEARLTDPLRSWETAWNLRDERAQLEALRIAATEDVRFTDLLVDVEGAEPLVAEIRRQQAGLVGELILSDTIGVFAVEDDRPRLVRHAVQIVLGDRGTIDIVNFIRLRGGRIERLSGFPALP